MIILNRRWRCCTFAAALVLLLSVGTGANDLLVINNAISSAVLRYDGSTGAFVGKFASFNGNGQSMTFGPDGNLYVGTSSNISRYDGQSGAFLSVFVPTTNGTTNPIPFDMAFGPDGNLYVTGRGNKSVWRYNGSSGQFLDAFTSTATFGSEAEGLTFGADGNLYVADGFNVDRYNPATGAFMNHFAGSGSGLERAGEVRFGPDGNLYVVGNSLLKFNGKTGAVLSALNSIGSEDFAFGLDGRDVHDGRMLLPAADVGGHLRNDRVAHVGREARHVDEHEHVRLLAGAEEQVVHRRGARRRVRHFRLLERAGEPVAGEVVEGAQGVPDVDDDDAVAGHATDMRDEAGRRVVLPGDPEDLVGAVVLRGRSPRHFQRHEHCHLGLPFSRLPLARRIFLHFRRRGTP